MKHLLIYISILTLILASCSKQNATKSIVNKKLLTTATKGIGQYKNLIGKKVITIFDAFGFQSKQDDENSISLNGSYEYKVSGRNKATLKLLPNDEKNNKENDKEDSATHIKLIFKNKHNGTYQVYSKDKSKVLLEGNFSFK